MQFPGGAFCGVLDGERYSPLIAAAGGVLVMGCQVNLLTKPQTPGVRKLRTGIIDAVSKMDGDTLIQKARVYES